MPFVTSSAFDLDLFSGAMDHRAAIHAAGNSRRPAPLPGDVYFGGESKSIAFTGRVVYGGLSNMLSQSRY